MLLVTVLALSGTQIFPSAALAQAARPAPAVVVEAVGEAPANTAPARNARIEAIEAVDIRPRVQGFIDKIAFAPGAYVQEGDLLFAIEPGRYEAALAAADAQVARAEAVLRQADDALERATGLVGRNVAARTTLEDAQAAFDIATADLAAARAARATAALDLSYTRITAPISGRIGLPTQTIGNFVGPETGTIARLVQTDPVRAVFSLAEGEVVTLRQQAAQGRVASYDNFRLELRLANGEILPQLGRIEFLDPEVDPATGTVAVRALFDNPGEILTPGQFAAVTLRNQNAANVLVVPQSAVLQDREGRFVFVLDQGDIAHLRRVATGAKIGDLWAVTSGLELGESVVVQGAHRLADGMAVAPADKGVAQ